MVKKLNDYRMSPLKFPEMTLISQNLIAQVEYVRQEYGDEAVIQLVKFVQKRTKTKKKAA